MRVVVAFFIAVGLLTLPDAPLASVAWLVAALLTSLAGRYLRTH